LLRVAQKKRCRKREGEEGKDGRRKGKGRSSWGKSGSLTAVGRNIRETH
jgi:hypothetical protein